MSHINRSMNQMYAFEYCKPEKIWTLQSQYSCLDMLADQFRAELGVMSGGGALVHHSAAADNGAIGIPKLYQ